MSLLFSRARLIASFSDSCTDSLPTPIRLRLGTGGKGRAWNVGIFGSRNGSFCPLGTVDPPGTLPAGGVGNGVACGVIGAPGNAVGLITPQAKVLCLPSLRAPSAACAGSGCNRLIQDPPPCFGMRAQS